MPKAYKAIYEAIRAALDAEASRRTGRTTDEWILAEREQVRLKVNRQRWLLSYDPVSSAAVG